MTNRHDWQTSISVFLSRFSEERMRDLQENDIHFIELTEGNMKHYADFGDTAGTIFRTAAAHGVTVRSVHLPFAPFEQLDPASLDHAVRRTFLEQQGELVKIAAAHGAAIAVVHPSAEPYDDAARVQHLEAAIDSLGKLNAIAETAGIRLAVENLPRTCMLRDAAEIRTLAAALPTVGFVFDSNHSLIDSNSDIIRAMGERIIATHISDYDFIDERHLFPAQGQVRWQEIMACLEEVDYTGTWNYELRGAHLFPAATFKSNHAHLLNGTIQ